MEAPGGAIPPKMFGKLRMEFWMDFARCCSYTKKLKTEARFFLFRSLDFFSSFFLLFERRGEREIKRMIFSFSFIQKKRNCCFL